MGGVEVFAPSSLKRLLQGGQWAAFGELAVEELSAEVTEKERPGMEGVTGREQCVTVSDGVKQLKKVESDEERKGPWSC